LNDLTNKNVKFTAYSQFVTRSTRYTVNSSHKFKKKTKYMRAVACVKGWMYKAYQEFPIWKSEFCY